MGKCSYDIWRAVVELKEATLARSGITNSEFDSEERAWNALIEALYEECEDDESK